MATEGARVTLLDLSPAAIEVGLKRAQASGVEVRGVAADASCLSMLGDAEFDLVFACAALHHTLKYPGAVGELARIMKPGARLVLCETWGGNPLLNTARKLHAALVGEAAEQGEDIILSQSELQVLSPFFSDVRVETRNLLAMGKRLLRGRFEKRWARDLVRTLERMDGALLALAPPLRNWCGEAVITARRR
jgi:SAM-dependent methyltransferase